MQTFSECFNIILLGDKDASRRAARQVRRLVYSSGEGDKFKLLASIIESAPEEYKKIIEEWRQENFVMAVSVMYFLHNKESHPDFLFPWLFHLIQHPNGNIRQAAVRMFQTELGPLTMHIRFPNEKSIYLGKLSPELADSILFGIFANLSELGDALWKPSYKRYKYISSLPSGAYKSVQMVLGELEEDCGKDYTTRLQDSYRKGQIMEDREAIIKRVTEGNILDKAALTMTQSKLQQMREDLEKEMAPMMLKFYPKFNFKNVVAQVYEGNLELAELIKLIDDSINLETHTINQRNAFLDLVSTIWNIYPHKELDGYSPYEFVAMYEIAKNHQSLASKK
jgi:hypothetical protein